jgi:thioester reductase-like protein
VTNFETAANVNPRPGNGSANVYDLLSQFQQAGTPYGAIPQQPYYQTPLAQQQRPLFQQHPYFQQPGFQQFGVQASQPFQQFQQQPFNLGAQWQSPWTSQWQQQAPYMQTPFAQQSFAPAITQRSAELKLKIPVHRLIGRHPQEVHQYLLQAVLPVLLDALTKRALNPELGLTVSSDQRGETVVEIDI